MVLQAEGDDACDAAKREYSSLRGQADKLTLAVTVLAFIFVVFVAAALIAIIFFNWNASKNELASGLTGGGVVTAIKLFESNAAKKAKEALMGVAKYCKDETVETAMMRM